MSLSHQDIQCQNTVQWTTSNAGPMSKIRRGNIGQRGNVRPKQEQHTLQIKEAAILSPHVLQKIGFFS